jgi:hypothetical protein
MLSIEKRPRCIKTYLVYDGFFHSSGALIHRALLTYNNVTCNLKLDGADFMQIRIMCKKEEYDAIDFKLFTLEEYLSYIEIKFPAHIARDRSGGFLTLWFNSTSYERIYGREEVIEAVIYYIMKR